MTATLTVATATADVIHLVLANPDAFNVGKVMRSDVNGTRSVRTQTGQLPSTGGSLDFFDYEAALTGTVTYTAYNTANAVIATTSHTQDYQHTVYLACPLYPSNGVVLADGDLDAATSYVTAWQAARAGRSTMHAVIGRSDPVPVLHGAAARAGTFAVICPDRAAAKQLEDQLSLPQAFQLRQTDVPGLDMYFVVAGLDSQNIADTNAPRWHVDVAFQEIAWPPGTFTPTSVWTYADVLAAGYGDYNGLAVSFATYATLLARQPLP